MSGVPRPGSVAREVLLRTSPNLTRSIGLRWGHTFPFLYVAEYQKSGGTWLSHMIADYLGLPFPQRSVLPVACAAVIHNHFEHDGRLRPAVYLYRDGRDVMVSLYFARMRRILDDHDPQPMLRAGTRLFYERSFGRSFDPADATANMAKFIEIEMLRRHRANWPHHVSRWCDSQNDGVVLVSYEELLGAPKETLRRVLTMLDRGPIDEEKLGQSVDRYTFERMTGRRRGQEDRGSFIRRGVAGDWKNHFDQAAREVFDSFAGPLLVELGYEPDRSWAGRNQAAGAAASSSSAGHGA